VAKVREDINGDRAINMTDIMLLAQCFNSVSGAAADMMPNVI
jgi:hypothetical protein